MEEEAGEGMEVEGVPGQGHGSAVMEMEEEILMVGGTGVETIDHVPLSEGCIRTTSLANGDGAGNGGGVASNNVHNQRDTEERMVWRGGSWQNVKEGEKGEAASRSRGVEGNDPPKTGQNLDAHARGHNHAEGHKSRTRNDGCDEQSGVVKRRKRESQQKMVIVEGDGKQGKRYKFNDAYIYDEKIVLIPRKYSIAEGYFHWPGIVMQPCTKVMRESIRRTPNGRIVMFLLPPINKDNSFVEDAKISEMKVSWVCYASTEENLRLVDVDAYGQPGSTLTTPEGASFEWENYSSKFKNAFIKVLDWTKATFRGEEYVESGSEDDDNTKDDGVEDREQGDAQATGRSEVDADLDKKRERSEVDADLEKKRERSEVDADLEKKRERSEVDADLEKKRERSEVEECKEYGKRAKLDEGTSEQVSLRGTQAPGGDADQPEEDAQTSALRNTAETTGENRDEEGAGEEGKRDGEVGETAAKVDETNNVELSEEQQREKDVYKRKIDFMRLQNTYRNDLGRIGSVKPSSIDIVGHKITAHTSIFKLEKDALDNRSVFCRSCSRYGHHPYECPQFFYQVFGELMPGFMPNGERNPGCWMEKSDGCSVLSADGLNEWLESLNRGYFQEQGMKSNMPPAPEGGWKLWPITTSDGSTQYLLPAFAMKPQAEEYSVTDHGVKIQGRARQGAIPVCDLVSLHKVVVVAAEDPKVLNELLESQANYVWGLPRRESLIKSAAQNQEQSSRSHTNVQSKAKRQSQSSSVQSFQHGANKPHRTLQQMASIASSAASRQQNGQLPQASRAPHTSRAPHASRAQFPQPASSSSSPTHAQQQQLVEHYYHQHQQQQQQHRPRSIGGSRTTSPAGQIEVPEKIPLRCTTSAPQQAIGVPLEERHHQQEPRPQPRWDRRYQPEPRPQQERRPQKEPQPNKFGDPIHVEYAELKIGDMVYKGVSYKDTDVQGRNGWYTQFVLGDNISTTGPFSTVQLAARHFDLLICLEGKHRGFESPHDLAGIRDHLNFPGDVSLLLDVFQASRIIQRALNGGDANMLAVQAPPPVP